MIVDVLPNLRLMLFTMNTAGYEDWAGLVLYHVNSNSNRLRTKKTTGSFAYNW